MELSIISMTFLHSQESVPHLAILHQDASDERHLVTYTVSFDKQELVPHSFGQSRLDPGASILISVPLASGMS